MKHRTSHRTEPRHTPPSNLQQEELTMRHIATATLSGNLTREVELRALPSGTDVARLRSRAPHAGKKGEDWVDRTSYFTVEVYGAVARACAECFRKGSRVIVDAELDWREWTDEQNNRREVVTLRARQVLFVGGRAGERNGHEAGTDECSSPPVGVTTTGDLPAGADDLPF
jgi:single stranded DNA-binding protein